MKKSGYNQKFRTEIVDSAMKAFDIMIENDRKGIKPLFRDRTWKSEERRTEKQNKKRNWFRTENNKYKSVLFVPPTPGSQLAKELQSREKTESNIFYSLAQNGKYYNTRIFFHHTFKVLWFIVITNF